MFWYIKKIIIQNFKTIFMSSITRKWHFHCLSLQSWSAQVARRLNCFVKSGSASAASVSNISLMNRPSLHSSSLEIIQCPHTLKCQSQYSAFCPLAYSFLLISSSSLLSASFLQLPIFTLSPLMISHLCLWTELLGAESP